MYTFVLRWMVRRACTTITVHAAAVEKGFYVVSDEIYEKLIADCALTPERTLFIDDTLPNVEGAMKLGINGFHMHEKGMMDRFFL